MLHWHARSCRMSAGPPAPHGVMPVPRARTGYPVPSARVPTWCAMLWMTKAQRAYVILP